jgi:hypothetical protein
MNSNKHFLNVSFSKPKSVEEAALEKVFDGAFDWVRYSRTAWILYTALEPEKWRDRVRKVPGMEEANIFVCKFIPEESSGYLPQWAWDWLYKKRS